MIEPKLNGIKIKIGDNKIRYRRMFLVNKKTGKRCNPVQAKAPYIPNEYCSVLKKYTKSHTEISKTAK
ncbi:hypothetical protein GCM10027035_43090 [Emticicia sediminis]